MSNDNSDNDNDKSLWETAGEILEVAGGIAVGVAGIISGVLKAVDLLSSDEDKKET